MGEAADDDVLDLGRHFCVSTENLKDGINPLVRVDVPHGEKEELVVWNAQSRLIRL